MEISFFGTALRRVPAAAMEIPPETVRRYASGQLPRVVRWLLRHPDLLTVLAELSTAQAAQESHEEGRE